MTHRERLETALRHKEPDRVPIDLGGVVTGITWGAHRKLREYLGIPGEEILIDRIQHLVKPSEQLLKRFDVDTRYVYLRASRDFQDKEFPEDDSYEDEWGVRRKRSEQANGAIYYDIVKSPLAEMQSVEELEKWNWPDPHVQSRYEGIEEDTVRLYKETDYAVIVNAIGSIYEFAWYLRGFENFLADLVINPSFAAGLIDGMLEFQMGLFEEILDRTGRYVSIVMVGDDISTQRGPAISPEIYRKIVKPRQKKFYDFIKSKSDAKLFYHSCGSTYKFLPDLIEIGVDIINPVQVKADNMDPARLKKEFGDALTFWGGIDTQLILPFGKPQEVKDEVKRVIDLLAPGGGYVFNSVHNIQSDVPPENVVAMFETALEYGVY